MIHWLYGLQWIFIDSVLSIWQGQISECWVGLDIELFVFWIFLRCDELDLYQNYIFAIPWEDSTMTPIKGHVYIFFLYKILTNQTEWLHQHHLQLDLWKIILIKLWALHGWCVVHAWQSLPALRTRPGQTPTIQFTKQRPLATKVSHFLLYGWKPSYLCKESLKPRVKRNKYPLFIIHNIHEYAEIAEFLYVEVFLVSFFQFIHCFCG